MQYIYDFDNTSSGNEQFLELLMMIHDAYMLKLCDNKDFHMRIADIIVPKLLALPT